MGAFQQHTRHNRKRDIDFERAQKHLEEARQFSAEMGGTDKDVKEYFFQLPPKKLDAILTEYGEKFGPSPEDYARQTFKAWRSGQRGMSGLVAKRLFDLLPPKMPLEKKYELAANIWRHSAPTTLHSYTIGQNTNIDELASLIEERLQTTITLHAIPQNLKNRFNWLAQGDIKVHEQLLNYFRQLEKGLILEKLKTEIPILQRQLANHPSTTHLLKSELVINHNRIVITLKNDTPPFVDPDPRQTPHLPTPHDQAHGAHSQDKPALPGWIWLAAFFIIIFLLTQIK